MLKHIQLIFAFPEQWRQATGLQESPGEKIAREGNEKIEDIDDDV